MSNTTNLIYQGVTGTEFIATVVLTTTDATILALPSIDGNITFDFWAYLYPPIVLTEGWYHIISLATTTGTSTTFVNGSATFKLFVSLNIKILII